MESEAASAGHLQAQLPGRLNQERPESEAILENSRTLSYFSLKWAESSLTSR